MMIRNYETIRGNERSAPAIIKTDTRFLEVLEPLRRWLELVFVFQLLERRKIEQPHAFVSNRRGR